MPVENHKDGCIHNVATSKMNHEIECHVLGIKVEFPFELIGIPKWILVCSLMITTCGWCRWDDVDKS